jgi:Mn2+/Fe2+ NRAMP family transporter
MTDGTTNVSSGQVNIKTPPRGLALLMVLGPGLMWCGEYIGSGEVILATRAGAVLGIAVLWVPLVATFAKFWIGLAGAHYTVCTGEGMIDMINRVPGPRNWIIWIVFFGQVLSGAIGTGALAAAAGRFAAYFIPVPDNYVFLLGWGLTLILIAIAWIGEFHVLKVMMSILVAVIVMGVFSVVYTVWPGWGAVFHGSFGFQLPETPAWAQQGATKTAWAEILPLLGWAAGGFASQVWYTYWILGAGYGMANGRGYGLPADTDQLKKVTTEDAAKLKGWCRVVTTDALVALAVGILVTAAFMIAGAMVLGPKEIAPEGPNVALELSNIFSEGWGKTGAFLFMLAGMAALTSTLMGQLAGWPRLLADCARILFPPVARLPWKTQFRSILVCFAVVNVIVVSAFQDTPVLIVKLGAIFDGLLLTPLQAVAAAYILYITMPRMFSEKVAKMLKPNPLILCGLTLAFFLFGYVCITQMPGVVGELLGAISNGGE